jgi:hypothetical protein
MKDSDARYQSPAVDGIFNEEEKKSGQDLLEIQGKAYLSLPVSIN